jgi:hypothetical protein
MSVAEARIFDIKRLKRAYLAALEVIKLAEENWLEVDATINKIVRAYHLYNLGHDTSRFRESSIVDLQKRFKVKL